MAITVTNSAGSTGLLMCTCFERTRLGRRAYGHDLGISVHSQPRAGETERRKLRGQSIELSYVAYGADAHLV